MDLSTTFFAVMTATLFIVAYQAWRLGNEQRDVALLGAMGGVSGIGAALAAIL